MELIQEILPSSIRRRQSPRVPFLHEDYLDSIHFETVQAFADILVGILRTVEEHRARRDRASTQGIEFIGELPYPEELIVDISNELHAGFAIKLAGIEPLQVHWSEKDPDSDESGFQFQVILSNFTGIAADQWKFHIGYDPERGGMVFFKSATNFMPAAEARLGQMLDIKEFLIKFLQEDQLNCDDELIQGLIDEIYEAIVVPHKTSWEMLKLQSTRNHIHIVIALVMGFALGTQFDGCPEERRPDLTEQTFVNIDR